MHKYIHLHTIYYTDTRVSHSIRRSRATKELSRCAETGFFIFLRQRSAFYANERMRSPTYVKYSQTFRDFNSFIPSSIFRRVRKTRGAFYANERMYRHDDFTWKVTKKKCSQTFPRIWNVFLLERVLKWFVFKKKLSSGLPIS